MKIWQLSSGYKPLMVDIEDETNPQIDEMLGNISRGQSMQQEWRPLRVLYKADKGKSIDFPRYAPAMNVFNDRAVSVLEPLIDGLVEFLPLIDDKYNFYFCNVINILDCVDHEKSVPEIMLDKIISYHSLYFKEDLLQTERRHIFKIPELVRTRVYVSDEFRDAVLEAGLKGLDFIQVWDSEFTKEDEIAEQQRYEDYLAELEQNKGTEMSWNEAMKLLDEGKAVASGHWKLQKNADKELLVGQLTYDLNYEFAQLIYIPPILLDLKWHEVERSE
ncbi:imm11 family protein [Paenibacillus enshidis]|uniref:Imm11 family protein n=1 Tax=Paenibacillus enshidis TaxID=1458439 RepID=A0ABV5AYY7_9BACL